MISAFKTIKHINQCDVDFTIFYLNFYFCIKPMLTIVTGGGEIYVKYHCPSIPTNFRQNLKVGTEVSGRPILKWGGGSLPFLPSIFEKIIVEMAKNGDNFFAIFATEYFPWSPMTDDFFNN